MSLLVFHWKDRNAKGLCKVVARLSIFMDEVDIPYWEQKAFLQDISTRVETSMESALGKLFFSILCTSSSSSF